MTEIAVGVDVGTTDTKAVALDPGGTPLAVATTATTWRQDGPLTDTTARDLREGLLQVLADVTRAVADGRDGPVRVSAVGITGMGESGVLLAPDGTVRAPVIAWFDARGTDEIAALPADVREAFPGTTGLPVSSLCTLAKLLWLRSRGAGPRPGDAWLNIPEYLGHVLGGDRAAEPSLAARTGLLDLDTGRAWDAALEAIGAGSDLLPPLVTAGTSLGRVGADAPAALRGAHVVVAGHDHPVASFGAGTWGADDLFDSFGTAESVLRVLSRPLEPARRRGLVALGLTTGHHVIEGRWLASGPTRAGLVLRRVLGLLGLDDEAGRERLDAGYRGDPGQITVGGAAIGDTDVTVAMGTDAVDPHRVWAAALQHTSTYVADLAKAIATEVGSPHQGVVVAGGWIRMSSVRAAKARAMPGVTFSGRQQAGAHGAALLAAWAAAGCPGTAVDFARMLRGDSDDPHDQGHAPPAGHGDDEGADG